LTNYNLVPETIAGQPKHLNEFGDPHSDMTPPVGWAIADNARLPMRSVPRPMVAQQMESSSIGQR
jgi:hypothetical protein